MLIPIYPVLGCASSNPVSPATRYRHSLARFLCGVYEGLMMRPPREVSTPSKWSSDDESPVRRSVKSVSSVKQDSSQPR